MRQASFILFTSWCLMAISSEAQQVVTNVSVVERDNVTFSCNGNDITLTYWFGPDGSGQEIIYSFPGQTTILDSVPQKNRLYIDLIQGNFNSTSLTIVNTMKTDIGRYHCNNYELQRYNIFVLQVNEPSATVYVTQSRQSIIPCPLTSVIDNLEWKGPPGITIYNSRGTTRLNINRLPASFVSRLAVDPISGALIINNTQRSDDNLYRCNVGGPQNYVQLTVLISPQNPVITNSTEEIGSGRRVVRATEDNEVSLICQVKGGRPQSYVKWLRGGVTGSQFPSSNSSQANMDGTYDVTSKVIVMARRSEDRMTYVCQAEHITWTSLQNVSLELYLYLRPTEPMMLYPGNIQENATLSSTCSISGCRPVATIMWSGAGTSFSTNIEDKATETFNVTSALQKRLTRQDNGAILQCIITHPALISSLVTSRNLTVWFSPTSVSISNNMQVTAGDSILLKCTTGVSNPAAKITWTNGTLPLSGGQNVDQNGEYRGTVRYQELTVLTTRYMDGNIITCTADNDKITGVGVSNSTMMDITFSPFVTMSIFPSTLVTEGTKHVILRCTAWSKPVSRLQLTKEDQILPTSDGAASNVNHADFTIATVNRMHAGTYSCLADNGVSGPWSDRQKIIELLVQYAPDISIKLRNVTIQDQKATLICSPHGYPDNYTFGLWQHSWPGLNSALRSLASVTTNKISILELHNLTYEDSGIYTCQASNNIRAIGTDQEFMEQSAYLLVRSAPKIVNIRENFEGRKGQSLLIQFDFYSNTEEKLSVTAKHINSSDILYEGTFRTIQLNNVLVKSFFVSAPGYRAILNINITSDNDFGKYSLEVGNIIGSDYRNILIIAQIPASPENTFSIGIGASIGIGIGGVAAVIIGSIAVSKIRRRHIVNCRQWFKRSGERDSSIHTYYNTDVNLRPISSPYDEINRENIESNVYDQISGVL